MPRIYKTIRLAYETKYWLDQLIDRRTERLKKSIREKGLQDRIEEQLLKMNGEELNGVSVNVSLNVTVGSVIEQAVRYSRDLTVEQWNALAGEVESAKRRIEDVGQNDVTPRIYLDQEIFRELEDLQTFLRQEGERIPRISYVIKLAAYNLYKNSSSIQSKAIKK